MIADELQPRFIEDTVEEQSVLANAALGDTPTAVVPLSEATGMLVLVVLLGAQVDDRAFVFGFNALDSVLPHSRKLGTEVASGKGGAVVVEAHNSCVKLWNSEVV